MHAMDRLTLHTRRAVLTRLLAGGFAVGGLALLEACGPAPAPAPTSPPAAAPTTAAAPTAAPAAAAKPTAGATSVSVAWVAASSPDGGGTRLN